MEGTWRPVPAAGLRGQVARALAKGDSDGEGTSHHVLAVSPEEGEYHMLLPWHIKNERLREVVSNGLREFTGYALVWGGSDQTTSPDQQHEAHRITVEMCQEVLQALHSQTDLERHAWIAAFPVEHDYLFSLLHAEVDPETGARVNLLLSSLVKQDDVRATGYEGDEGEFVLLTMVLERLGVTRLEVPLQLDTHRTGLTYAGWIERTPGAFIWENPGRANSSH